MYLQTQVTEGAGIEHLVRKVYLYMAVRVSIVQSSI